jgi:MFS family permease
MLVAYVCTSMFRMSISVVLPEMAREFSLIEAQSGAFFSSLFLGTAMTMAIAGYVSDRLGRGITSAVGLSLISLGLLLAGYSNSYSMSLSSFFIGGLGLGIFVSSLYAAMGEILPRSRGFLTGLTNGFYAFGAFLGPWLSGNIANSYGWRMPFYILGLVGFPIALSLWFFRSKILGGKRNSAEGLIKASYVNMLKTRNVLVVSIALSVANIGFGSFAAWTPTFLSSVDGLDITQTGLAFGVWALAGGVGAIALGWLSDRLSRRVAILGPGILAAILAYFYFISVNSLLIVIALSAALGFVSFAYWSLFISLAQDSVDPAAIGSVTGLVQNISITGEIVAPMMAATLIMTVGIVWAMIASVSIPYLIQGFIVLASKEGLTATSSRV